MLRNVYKHLTCLITNRFLKQNGYKCVVGSCITMAVKIYCVGVNDIKFGSELVYLCTTSPSKFIFLVTYSELQTITT